MPSPKKQVFLGSVCVPYEPGLRARLRALHPFDHASPHRNELYTGAPSAAAAVCLEWLFPNSPRRADRFFSTALQSPQALTDGLLNWRRRTRGEAALQRGEWGGEALG